jgi:hypothetical protein
VEEGRSPLGYFGKCEACRSATYVKPEAKKSENRLPSMKFRLTNRVLKQQVPVVVLARTLTPTAKSFLAQCKHGSFLALEASGVNTRAYCAAHPNGLDLPVENLWEFGRFLVETIGKP